MLRAPDPLVDALQYLRDKERRVRVYLPRAAFAAEQSARPHPIEFLAFMAQNEPKVIQVTRSRPFRLLLQESSHLLGEDLLLVVGGNGERGKIRIQRSDRTGHWLRENRLVESQMDLDFWKPLSAGTAAAVLYRNLDLEVPFDCPSPYR